MHDLAVGTETAAHFLRAERSPVPFDRLGRAVQRQLRGDGVIPGGDGLRCFRHWDLLDCAYEKLWHSPWRETCAQIRIRRRTSPCAGYRGRRSHEGGTDAQTR